MQIKLQHNLDELIKLIKPISDDIRSFSSVYHVTQDKFVYTNGYVIIETSKPRDIPLETTGNFKFNGVPSPVNYPNYKQITFDNSEELLIDIEYLLKVANLVKPQSKKVYPYISTKGYISTLSETPEDSLNLEYICLANKLILGSKNGYRKGDMLKITDGITSLYLTYTKTNSERIKQDEV